MQTYLAGIDEVGRGCLAGPVIAACVVFPDVPTTLDGLTDSKLLSARRREALTEAIRRIAVEIAIGRVEAREIDRVNVGQASLLAMRRAFEGLTVHPDHVFVDGRYYPEIDCPGTAVVKGDLLVPVISAASIIAKVWRDREMQVAELLFPGYGFARNKSYPTVDHRTALVNLGATPMHRHSFSLK